MQWGGGRGAWCVMRDACCVLRVACGMVGGRTHTHTHGSLCAVRSKRMSHDKTANMILCIGTTPAAQRVMVFRHLALNEVNRAAITAEGAAGKSINVAKVLQAMG